MDYVRRALIGIVILITACGPSTDSTTTALPGPPTTGGQLTTTSTAAPSQDLRIQDCETPPVTFSPLCEVYELIQEWHVDRPVSAEVLAEVALDALQLHRSTTSEPAPRTLFCAIPDQAFTDFCGELAHLVDTSEIAVGPAVEEAVLAMADLGLDPFTYYVPPDQVGAVRLNGIVGGVGILLDATDAVGSKCARLSETCPLEIIFVLEDNPGEEAGLMAGDEIISVDGEPVDGRGFAATATAIAGDESGVIQVTVDRDGEAITFDIQRAPLEVPTVEVDLPFSDVGYLRIPDFEDDITPLVDEALASLSAAGPETIVIDLRDNPGGLVKTVVDVASQFIDGGLIMETTAPGEQLDYTATPNGLATTERLFVLVNRGTASAAEVLAGALRDQRSAVLVGESTFGKDAVQIPFQLRNGGELYVAVARWSTPLGLTASDGGLKPDRELELPADMSVDELVQAALDAGT